MLTTLAGFARNAIDGIDVLQMIQDEIRIRRCANPECLKYFVFNDKREKYCGRNKSPSCEEVGKKKNKEKREAKPLYIEYRKAQSKYLNYVRRREGISKEEYDFWNVEAIRLREEGDKDKFMKWCKLKKDEIAFRYEESLKS